MVCCISPYFAVFPDQDVLGQATDRLPASQTLASHPSGRPWLVGSLPADQLLLVEVGERRLAVIGHCSVEPDRLRAELDRIDDVAQLDRIARTLTGSFHLVAVVGERMRIQGSLSGLRRVFHAQVGTARIAADRSDILAAVLGVSPDPDVLALRMFTGLPYPLSEQPVWPEVEQVPAWHYLDLGVRDSRHRTVRWWHPPEGKLDVTAGAPLLRTALDGAVDARTRGGGVVSADLSGGLDSTPLCALAARGPAKVVALTFSSDLDTDDDLRWARIAHQSFPEVEHVVVSLEDIPGFYAGLDRETAPPG